MSDYITFCDRCGVQIYSDIYDCSNIDCNKTVCEDCYNEEEELCIDCLEEDND